MRAALRYGVIVLAVLLFQLALRRSGERAGRLAERFETSEETNDVQRRMMDAAAPVSRKGALTPIAPPPVREVLTWPPRFFRVAARSWFEALHRLLIWCRIRICGI
jgi:hypothetical protein